MKFKLALAAIGFIPVMVLAQQAPVIAPPVKANPTGAPVAKKSTPATAKPCCPCGPPPMAGQAPNGAGACSAKK